MKKTRGPKFSKLGRLYRSRPRFVKMVEINSISNPNPNPNSDRLGKLSEKFSRMEMQFEELV